MQKKLIGLMLAIGVLIVPIFGCGNTSSEGSTYGEVTSSSSATGDVSESSESGEVTIHIPTYGAFEIKSSDGRATVQGTRMLKGDYGDAMNISFDTTQEGYEYVDVSIPDDSDNYTVSTEDGYLRYRMDLDGAYLEIWSNVSGEFVWDQGKMTFSSKADFPSYCRFTIHAENGHEIEGINDMEVAVPATYEFTATFPGDGTVILDGDDLSRATINGERYLSKK